ncbi:Predicted dehydrogenase [Butyrivibrio fibrisolvens DSM 3071]|uniref:Predicted dehydrogenase n=1 Tax=Butyrivibrio fibrisolvens DSM 3071 TaxID=1121131 RepID=A0A1M5WD38_BUTFI|nr:Gfo/Idh/MocA family oxidoreductase [Butyrivibrio fibrisolvens]SHH85391.1 Predicted dehydrogenase [Butyrivibrio fibrisolvens DSM 3071]
MEEVRIGIIGIGGMGTNHARTITEGQVPGLRLTAVADVRQARLDWARENLPEDISLFSDGKELIDSGKCDAVLIATPHYFHPEYVIYALEHGVHALSEKPAGVYTKQVRQMNEVAAKSDKVFAIMFNQRTNCVYRKLHEMIESGELGKLKRVNWIITDWYRTQAYYDAAGWKATWVGEGGGVLLNQCPHQLDLLQWLCGLPVKVRAFCHEAKWHDIEVEDDVTAYMEFEGGATGVFVTTTGDAPGTNRLELTFDKAKIVCEHDKLIMDKLKISEREFCKTEKNGFAKPETERIIVETDGMNEQHVGVFKAFTNKILHNSPLIADGQEGINGLMLSNAMFLSSWLDKTVELPIDEDLFLEELNKRRKTSKLKEDTGIVFDTTGTY